MREGRVHGFCPVSRAPAELLFPFDLAGQRLVRIFRMEDVAGAFGRCQELREEPLRAVPAVGGVHGERPHNRLRYWNRHAAMTFADRDIAVSFVWNEVRHAFLLHPRTFILWAPGPPVRIARLARLEPGDFRRHALPQFVAARTGHKLPGKREGGVPVLDIAKALDVLEVHTDRFDRFEGMLMADNVRSTGCILANTSKNHRRAWFTVAHEPGHFLMERHQLSADYGFTCLAQDMREMREGRQYLHQKTQVSQFAIEFRRLII